MIDRQRIVPGDQEQQGAEDERREQGQERHQRRAQSAAAQRDRTRADQRLLGRRDGSRGHAADHDVTTPIYPPVTNSRASRMGVAGAVARACSSGMPIIISPSISALASPRGRIPIIRPRYITPMVSERATISSSD